MNLLNKFREIRQQTEYICSPLKIEDYVVQPIVDVSPPKWHLGHTTWFFETFVLKKFKNIFNPDFQYIFNSYYETEGERILRTDRGNLSRPTVTEVYEYRKYVNEGMELLLEENNDPEILSIVELGLNHEQQHQELLLTDIKYILGNNPLFPVYDINANFEYPDKNTHGNFIHFAEGIYEIGFREQGFCWDNELEPHKVYLNDFIISASLVTNDDYIEFIENGGYEKFSFWHSDGWAWVKSTNAKAPMYWHKIKDEWYNYTLAGLKLVNRQSPLSHINFYEASAFAAYKNMRLPTEFEWEIASHKFKWGRRWEWTNSAYLPYPGYKKAEGAIGEYNGKFMINQMVLRGGSDFTPKGHSRHTYRNFFQPNLQWQLTGLRLAK